MISSKQKQDVIIYLVLLFGVLSIVGFALYFQKPSHVTERIPGFPLKRFDGEVMLLEEMRGRPIVMNFWASWCTFCVAEIPVLQKMQTEFAGRGLVVLGVHRSETEPRSVAEKFIKQFQVSYDLIEDANDRMFNYFGGGAPTVPITVFITKDGYVENKIVGPRSEQQMRALIQKIIN